MTINNVNTISSLNEDNLLSEIIDRVNESFIAINTIVGHVNGEICPVLVNIGDVNNISGFTNLVDQGNYVYNLVNQISFNNGLIVEFSPTVPDITDCYGVRPFYFDTTSQVLMVYNSTDQTYYPSYGGASVQQVDCVDAPDYILPDCPTNPNVCPPDNNTPVDCPCDDTPVVIDPSCYVPTPALANANVRKVIDLPSNIDTIAAVTINQNTYIFSRNQNVMDLYVYNINTNVTNLVENYTFYKKDFTISVAQDMQSIWIVGGRNLNDTISNEIYNINLSDGSIISTTNTALQIVPSNISYNLDKSVAYFFGGTQLSNNGFTMPTNNIFKLDMTTGMLEEIAADVPFAMVGAASTKYSNTNNKVYIAGGRTSNDGSNNSLLSEIYCFDTSTETLSHVSDLPEPRSDGILICGNCELFYVGGYKTGGNNCFEKSMDVLKIIPHTNNWTFVNVGQFILPCNSTFADELKNCGYALFVIENSLSRDSIYIMGT